MNLLLINFSMMSVGSTGSLRSRGYLLGLAEAVVQQFAELEPTQEEFLAGFTAAFLITYGECDWSWISEAIESFQAGDKDTFNGAKLGRVDVLAAYSGQPFSVTSGFWLLNNGDEVTIEYSLANLPS